ncbi:hypothetical protein LO772_05920 [Yinghuangia sp. ASG 101]|uniref:hypothetical protein n=1 Tax=Yinghuangia sp. ASG 101 TaxID=2896848 RepID=UPI001E29C3BF|nr:hypothetical protein [Yinghuangia sp. ASG 101]UGQ13152.1 hypothetical protein LO772_05920 [Yinghuangia sp. ASG 101]
MIVIVLGLLIAAASAAFVALLIAYNTSGGPEYSVSMFDNHVVTLNTLAAFVSGLALALIFSLGLALAWAAMRMHRRGRRKRGYGTTTDAALRERSARHAAEGDWQADPGLHGQGTGTARPRHGSTDFPGGLPPTGRDG